MSRFTRYAPCRSRPVTVRRSNYYWPICMLIMQLALTAHLSPPSTTPTGDADDARTRPARGGVLSKKRPATPS
eukprot:1577127-Pleurochrysis_carterae.AAC.1